VRVSELSVVGGVIFDSGMNCISDLFHATTYKEIRKILEDLLTQSDKLQQLRNDGIILNDEFSLLNKHLLSIGSYAINRYFHIQEE